MNSLFKILPFESTVSYINFSFIKSDFRLIMKAQEEMEKTVKTMQPMMDYATKQFKCLQRIVDSMPIYHFPIKEIERINSIYTKLLLPLQELQKDWGSVLYGLKILDQTENQKTTIKLIQYKEGKVIFELKNKSIRKNNSLHLLLLKALLLKSDKNGFISYEEIEKYFIENDCSKIQNKRKCHKRIWDAQREIFRFLGISRTYNGQELIRTIKGKGFMLNNPDISV